LFDGKGVIWELGWRESRQAFHLKAQVARNELPWVGDGGVFHLEGVEIMGFFPISPTEKKIMREIVDYLVHYATLISISENRVNN
jgi:hypothetical protein